MCKRGLPLIMGQPLRSCYLSSIIPQPASQVKRRASFLLKRRFFPKIYVFWLWFIVSKLVCNDALPLAVVLN